MFPSSSSHIIASTTFTHHGRVIDDCQQDWTLPNLYGELAPSGIAQTPRNYIDTGSAYPRVRSYTHCPTPYEASDSEKTFANMNHRKRPLVHRQPFLHTSDGMANRSEGVPHSGWQPRATSHALHRSPAANLSSIPTDQLRYHNPLSIFLPI